MGMTEVIDRTTAENPGYPDNGELFVCRDPDQEFIPGFMKDGDIGLDLPVKLSIDRIKFGDIGKKPGKLRSPMLYPDLKQYIFLDGDGNNPNPCMEIPAFGWAEVPAGLSIKLPDDAWGLLKGRSSVSWANHLIVIGGVIDLGYVGLLGTLVYNPNQIPVKVYEYDPVTKTGDCLSQLILIPKYDLKRIILTSALPDTKRGTTGFGSTTKSPGAK